MASIPWRTSSATARTAGYTPHIAILLATALAYFGAPWLGHGTDTYSDLEMYRTVPWQYVAANLVFNRYPMWGLVVYPVLLWLPLWLAHLLVIATQALAALFLFRLLRWFQLGDATAVLAALLFLLWPAHAETLFWLSGGMGIFGVCCTLAGALILTRGHTLVALLVMFVAMLFSEGIFLPTLFLLGLMLWRMHVRPVRMVILLSTPIVAYAVFQVLRLTLSPPGDFAPYSIGLSHLPKNAVFLVLMTLGLASSRDVVWMWLASKYPVDVGILLPLIWLLPALSLAVIATLAIRMLPAASTALLPLRAMRRLMAVALAGYCSALLIFLLLVGNEMQTRYTCTAVAYLSVLLALPLGWMLAQGRRVLVYTGMVCTVLLLGWSLYRSWSNIWVNWYPARLVSEHMIDDVRQTYDDTGTQRILLVNEPRSVGNAYSLGRDWAYRAAARMFVSPRFYLSSEELNETIQRPDFGIGSRFSSQSCVFLSWRAGQRVVTEQAFYPAKRLVLNCSSGFAESWERGVPPTLVLHPAIQVSRENLRQFLGE